MQYDSLKALVLACLNHGKRSPSPDTAADWFLGKLYTEGYEIRKREGQ